MANNPYQTPASASSGADAQTSSQRSPLVVRFFFPVVSPVIVAFGLYLPFWFVASKINLTRYATNDNFYHRAAILTWPTYAAVVAIILALAASRVRLGWLGWFVCLVHGFIAMFNTQYLDVWIGLYGGPRSGLDSWPSNFPNTNTAQLSVFSIPFVYLIATITTVMFTRRLSRSASHPTS